MFSGAVVVFKLKYIISAGDHYLHWLPVEVSCWKLHWLRYRFRTESNSVSNHNKITLSTTIFCHYHNPVSENCTNVVLPSCRCSFAKLRCSFAKLSLKSLSHTEKYFSNFVNRNQCRILITLFRKVCHQSKSGSLLNLSKKGNYNPNLVLINKIPKIFLCMHLLNILTMSKIICIVVGAAWMPNTLHIWLHIWHVSLSFIHDKGK